MCGNAGQRERKTHRRHVSRSERSGRHLLAVIGTIMARRFLEWTHVDAAALDKATVYLTIYFLGMPIMMLYNFAASILRAVGDTFRPLIFLVIGGVANVILNIFFVLVVGWDVEGVAIATVVSQAVSATLCIVTIAREKVTAN